MSLSKEAFEKSKESLNQLNDRVNNLFIKSNLALKDKVQMDHYGRLYLFGQIVDECTDDDIANIIALTPEKSWNGHIDFFGQWINPE